MIIMPEIDLDKCNGCGLCIAVCAPGAIVLLDNRIIIVETEDCGWCVLCEAVCPTGAIRCPFEIVIEQDSAKD